MKILKPIEKNENFKVVTNEGNLKVNKLYHVNIKKALAWWKSQEFTFFESGVLVSNKSNFFSNEQMRNMTSSVIKKTKVHYSFYNNNGELIWNKSNNKTHHNHISFIDLEFEVTNKGIISKTKNNGKYNYELYSLDRDYINCNNPKIFKNIIKNQFTDENISEFLK